MQGHSLARTCTRTHQDSTPTSPLASSRASYTLFQAVDRAPITAESGSWAVGPSADGNAGGGGGWEGGRGGGYSEGPWEGGVAGDVYGRFVWRVRGLEEEWERTGGTGEAESDDDVQARMGLGNAKQLNICANSAAKSGFFFSGVVPSPRSECAEGFKSCLDWCQDDVSSKYRHASHADGGGRGGGAPASCPLHLLLPEPVGVYSAGMVGDGRMSASSERAANTSAARARLHSAAGFWSPATDAVSEYIQVEFESEERHIIAVGVQGGGNRQDAWLSQFKIAFLPLNDAGREGWRWIKTAAAGTEAGASISSAEVFAGSTDPEAVALVYLNRQHSGGIRAKALRIYPHAWGSASPGTSMALRFELYRGVCRGGGAQGVAYGEIGGQLAVGQLVSVGLRNAQGKCRAGFAGDGVHCVCPAQSSAGVLAYWRFEPSVFTSSSSSTSASSYWHVPDARSGHALGTPWFDEGGVRNTRNDLQFAARGAAPHLPIFVRTSDASVGGITLPPRNLPWAVLCVPNDAFLSLPGARGESGEGVGEEVGLRQGLTWGPFLQTLPHAAMNWHKLTAFTIELAFFISRDRHNLGEVCLLDRPSSSTSSAPSPSGSSLPGRQDCPSIRLVLSRSNRVVVTWSNEASHLANSSAAPVWRLSGLAVYIFCV